MKKFKIKKRTAKRLLAMVMALVMVVCAIPSFAITAFAASSSDVANAVRANLPIVTRACPLSGESKVYPYASETSNTKLYNRYIDTFKDDIVATAISADGKRVRVMYPAGNKYAELWFSADDIFGVENVNIVKYTAGSKYDCYRLSSSSNVTNGGSIASKDAVTVLGKRVIGGTTYYVSIYPVSRQTVNKVGNITHKIALCKYCPSNTSNSMVDVTRSFDGKKVTLKSVQNGMYLSADSNLSNTPATCNRSSASTSSSSWEVFTVKVTSDGWAGFKAYNGKWLTARIDITNSPIRATADNLLSWECFRIYQKGNDFYLKSQANNKWLCVRVDMSNAPVQAYASAASTWERFSIKAVSATTPAPSPSPSSTAVWDFPMKNAYCTWSSSTNMSWANHRYGTSGGRNYHLGLDIYGSGGTVYAAADGVVKTYSTSNGGANGRFVVIEHQLSGKTIYSFYAHLSSINTNNVCSGQRISRGTAIGTAGGSGYNSNTYYRTHLHFAIVDTYWSSGKYWGYAYSNDFSGNTAKIDGVTFYNPNYVVKNDRLP